MSGVLEKALRAKRDAGRKLLVPYITGGLDGAPAHRDHVVADQPVRDLLLDSRETTVHATYIYALLLHASSPYELSPRHFVLVQRWLARWSGKVVLSASPPQDFKLPPLGYLLGDGVWWIWPILLGVMLTWWWWEFEDWRTDEYRLTTKSVIEIERTPFSLNERRRESPDTGRRKVD